MPTAYTNRPTLNFDAPEPAVATDANASALFPQQPVYARTPTRKASSNLPLLVGVPVVAVVAGGLIWAMTANRTDAPTDQRSLQTAAAESPAPLRAPLAPEATPSPIPQPTEVAANETPAPVPAPVARAITPRAAPVRATARRVAPTETSAPDASSASADVSATVAAAPTVSAAPAPAIADPAPLVVPAPTAPAPTTEPSAPM